MSQICNQPKTHQWIHVMTTKQTQSNPQLRLTYVIIRSLT
ncbi:hypothetical protein AO366_1363 [Moraxella catarrhalis]|nr:hypothetical protein AO368_0899 [Moraxella catarrhalis]OAV32953.1 hypothetical protein AO366_1363 [Moraxella catarrhalis]